MMEELWHPCTYIPYISFGHHKQTNLPSANSPLDMLMPALNGCIYVHGVYLPFPEFLNQLYVTRYKRRRKVAPFDTYDLIAGAGVATALAPSPLGNQQKSGYGPDRAPCLPANCRIGCRSRTGKDMNLPWMPILLQTGMMGLEPTTSCSQSTRASICATSRKVPDTGFEPAPY